MVVHDCVRDCGHDDVHDCGHDDGHDGVHGGVHDDGHDCGLYHVYGPLYGWGLVEAQPNQEDRERCILALFERCVFCLEKDREPTSGIH